jgi:hypothetical protein
MFKNRRCARLIFFSSGPRLYWLKP